MGAVLEMILRANIRTALMALTAAAALTACGSERSVKPLETAKTVIGLLTGPKAAPLDIRAAFTPEVLATVNQPLLAAEMPVRRANATLILAGENAGHRSWVAADGISLITKDGILTGTRGLGRDLMVSDVREVLPALRAGSGTITREMSRMDDESHVTPTRYSCTVARGGPQQVDLISRQVATTLVTESCESAAGEVFVNRYWLDSSGRVRQSDQWAGPNYGNILMYQLVD